MIPDRFFKNSLYLNRILSKLKTGVIETCEYCCEKGTTEYCLLGCKRVVDICKEIFHNIAPGETDELMEDRRFEPQSQHLEKLIKMFVLSTKNSIYHLKCSNISVKIKKFMNLVPK